MKDADQGYLERRANDVAPMLLIASAGAAIAGLYSLFFSHPTPPPPASAFRGCFEAASAPTLRFDGASVHFGQPGLSVRPYHLQLAKYGTIDVMVDPPATPILITTDRFAYEDGEQRTIVFGELGHIVNGKTYGVFTVPEAQFLDVLTPEIENIRYQRVSPDRCSRPSAAPSAMTPRSSAPARAG